MIKDDPAAFTVYLREIARLHPNYGWARDFIDAADTIDALIGKPAAPKVEQAPLRKRRSLNEPVLRGGFFGS